MGAVGLVLLVSCVNVASLLARGATRERESACGPRPARGASARPPAADREPVLPPWAVSPASSSRLVSPGTLALVGDRIPVPRIEQLRSICRSWFLRWRWRPRRGLLGVVPALVTTKQPNDTLRDGGRHGGSRRLHQVLRTLVVSEVAISLVLLAGAGLLLRSFIKLQSVDPGFRAGGVLTAEVDLPTTSYDTAHAEVAFPRH
jgi:hypothetical protein